MQVNDSKYLKHDIFKELEVYQDFYDSLSTSIMHFVTSGTKAINFDTYVFSSMAGTIESIKLLLAKGRINDGYALLRKFHDSIIINSYAILYLQKNLNLENFIVEKIDNWLNGKEKLPDYNHMKQYLDESEELSKINCLLLTDRRYAEIRKQCNNHMHYNSFFCMMLNDNEIYNKNRSAYLDRISRDLHDLFILHFGYIFSLNPYYMSSSDYMDAMECGLTPEEGSQYFIAPFIQEAFDKFIRPRRPDIAKVIKENSGMQLQ